MRIIFDVQHLYYLPQYLPVYDELRKADTECLFLFEHEAETDAQAREFLEQVPLPHLMVEGRRAALREIRERKPDWVIFGNNFPWLDELPATTRSALLYHGIGVKECYYDHGLMQMDVRFVEGTHRFNELSSRYPDARFVDVGFAKLDPALRGETTGIVLEDVGLDRNRPTLLYAPTYYPSSIECLADDFPSELADCNLIIKPHQFSYSKKRYRRQREKLQRWSQLDNVWLADPGRISLLPMMQAADLLISEASSALFEFAALDKPIVWCDFQYRRWSHRGPLRFRLNRRMDPTIEKYRDIARHVARPTELPEAIRAELAAPGMYSAKRKQYTEELIGNTDGYAAKRIANYLLENC